WPHGARALRNGIIDASPVGRIQRDRFRSVKYLALVAGLSLCVTAACSGNSTDDTPVLPALTSLKVTPVATGLASPLYLTAPTGDARLFVVEQAGRIRIVRDGQLLATP